jgi:ATP-dependent exoDNAse (exonuclease V) beta subunit
MITRTKSKIIENKIILSGIDEWKQRDCSIYYNKDKRCFVSLCNPPYSEHKENYLSVTKWIHRHFEPFDADKVIEKMMNSPKWPQSKYYELTVEEIKHLWKKKGEEASRKGTYMHSLIEEYYNGKHTLKELNDKYGEKMPEISQFYNYEINRLTTYGTDWKPYRTEWRVFDEDLLILGIIDMVYIDPSDNQLILCDWKRANDIKKSNPWQQSRTECISHIPDTNFWHYSLQLNMYKHILETKYKKKVKKMYLAVFHPEINNYLKIDIPVLTDEMKNLIQLRIEEI